jgi:histidinol-phosphatase
MCRSTRSTLHSRTARRRLLAVAESAARAGGERTRRYFGRRITADRKSDGSPVTVADRASERAIRSVLRAEFPTHSVEGEEEGSRIGSDPRYRWFVDPLDGTKSFLCGVPIYAVLVAVEVEASIVAGACYLPELDEMVSAARGLGCRVNRRRARVSRVSRLAEATLVTTSVRSLEDRGLPFRRLSQATALQRGWGDAYGYAMVATGRADVMLDASVHVWDVAPFSVILPEAGGRLSNWSGATDYHGPNAVGTNGRLHPAVLRLLRQHGGRRRARRPSKES